MIRSLPTIPAPVTGYALDDVFEIVVPVARINLITNPSFEVATTSWTAIGGSIARSATYQYHGVYSLAITPTAATTDGARFDTVTLTSGTIYAYSAKVKGVKGLKYKLCLETTGGVELTSVTFTATGRWQWIYGYYTETSSTTRRLTVRKAAHASTAVFYLDGAQIEAVVAGETVSTYIDGDQQGLVSNQFPPAFLWTGTPHASVSTRSGLTRAGGMVVRLSKYNFLLTAIIGLGLATPQNVATEYARLDGAFADYTRKPTRQFSLAGTFEARSYQQLRDRRGALAALLDRDLIAQDQALILRHHLEDASGQVLSDTALIPAKYAGGLDGQTDNHYAQAAALSFVQYLPFVVAEGQAGAALTVQQSVSDADNILLRSASGVWSAIGTGADSFVYATTFGLIDEYLYFGGPFTSVNGVSNTRAVVRYSLSSGAVSAMGTGGPAGAIVYAIATAPNGHVWAVGSFSSMGGAANSAGVGHWDGSSWSGHTYPGTGTPRAVTVGPTGIVYIGSNTGQVHSWNGTSWTLLGTAAGSGADVFALVIGPDGNLYVAGDFTSVSAVSAASAARYTLSASSPAWEALSGTPSSRLFYALAFGSNGLLYIGGSDNTGLVPVLYSYNGVAWTSLATFTGSGPIWALQATPVGIYVGGTFTTVNGITFPDGIGIWNGATLSPADVNLPGSANVFAIARRADGTLAVGHDQSGTATAAGITTVTNAGTAKAYPTLTIKGPSSGTSRVYQIINYTTNRAIYLNYTINAGETARLMFQPDNLSFISDFQGNIANKILPGSNEADFFLQPGANSISFYAAGSSVTATLEWQPLFASLDDIP